MSRSYKKHPYDTICSSYGDKWCRNYYHRAERRKIKRLLNEEIKLGIEKPIVWDKSFCVPCIDSRMYSDYEIPYEKYGVDFPNYDFCCCYNNEQHPAEKIINKKDYSLKYADKWSWASDGGTYYQSDLSDLRRKFDEEVFGFKTCKPNDTIWSKYKFYVEKKYNDYHPTLKIFLSRKVMKEFCLFHEPYYEEEIEEKKCVEVPYDKQHKFNKSILKGGWEVYRFCKITSAGWHKDGRWESIYFGMMPTTLQNSEEVVEWLRQNEERMLRTIYRMRYGK